MLIGVLAMLTSCLDIRNSKTTIEVEANESLHHPILAGKQKDISFNLKNTGRHPLIITDIITSCGCLQVGKGLGTFTVPPGKEGILTLSYNSAKNIGYVKHYITLYGNFDKALYHEIVFDIQVIPNSQRTMDYEEYYTSES